MEVANNCPVWAAKGPPGGLENTRVRLVISLVCAMSFAQLPALAQSGEQPTDNPNLGWRENLLNRVSPRFWELLEMSQQFANNWDEQADYIQFAAERVFAVNGWDSEPDRFALDTISEVERIPPWDMQGRIDTLMARLSDRWQLTEEQAEHFEYMAMQEAMKFFSENTDTIVEIAAEVIQTRAQGEEFTEEQVARFAEKAVPLFNAGKQRFEVAKTEWLETLTPEQRELAKKDVEAADNRVKKVDKLGKDWVAGVFPQRQLALESIAAEKAAKAAAQQIDPATGQPTPAGGGAGKTELGPDGQPVDPATAQNAALAGDQQPAEVKRANAAKANAQPTDPWAAYTRDFIRRFALTSDQEQRAWLLYGQTLDRAHRLVNSRAKPGAPEASSALNEALGGKANEKQRKQLESIFDSLKSRLDRLPTRAQREKAQSAAKADEAKAAPAKKP